MQKTCDARLQSSTSPPCPVSDIQERSFHILSIKYYLLFHWCALQLVCAKNSLESNTFNNTIIEVCSLTRRYAIICCARMWHHIHAV